MATKTYGDRPRYVSLAEAEARKLEEKRERDSMLRWMSRGEYDSPMPGLTDEEARAAQADAARGTLEVPAAIGSSVLADIPAGWAGLLSEEDRAGAVEKVRDEFTVAPRSKSGQRAMASIGNAIETIFGPATRANDAMLAAGQRNNVIPLVTVPLTGITALAEAIPGRRPAAAAARAARAAPDMPPSGFGGVGDVDVRPPQPMTGQYIKLAEAEGEFYMSPRAKEHYPIRGSDPAFEAEMKRQGQAIAETMGRKQRGSIDDTGAGREVLATQAARNTATNMTEDRFKARDFNAMPSTNRAKDEFNQRLSEARQRMDPADAAQVDEALPKNFDGKTYMTSDGAAGFAVSKDGYVSNLYKMPGAPPGAMGAALTKARAEGARNLEAFDTYLARGYINRGAVETGRFPWDPSQATPEIRAALGDKSPDFVQMDIGGQIPTQKHSNIIGPREQNVLNRQPTPRGEPKVVAESFKGGRVNRLNRIVDKGIEAGGEKWYWMAGMLDKFILELGPELGVQRFDQFMDLNAAVSPRSSVAQQIKRASVLYQRQLKGMPIENLSHDMFPAGYGHMATTTAHRPAVDRVVREGAVGDPVKQPKIATYAENMKGNYQGVTVDSHNNLIVTGREGSPGGAQYVHLEGRQQQLAARRELDPAEWQSALWVGGGDITDVKDVRNLPDAMNQRIAKTAEVLGVPEEEALVRFMHGDTVLYSTMAAMFGLGVHQAAQEAEEKGSNALNN